MREATLTTLELLCANTGLRDQVRVSVCLQVEMKLMVACVVSRLHVTLDPDRMVHIHSVDDYMADLITTLTLKSARPTWLRMRPRSSSL